jgi:hypothetical protein
MARHVFTTSSIDNSGRRLWERRIGLLHAAVAALKLQRPERILVAVAVAARETRDEFKNEQQIISSCE